jgi:hypothetical protein
MSEPRKRECAEPLLGTGGIFVIQLRSDSNIKRRRLFGRIEHVMSGESERFACLADILDFMTRHPDLAGQQATASEKRD